MEITAQCQPQEVSVALQVPTKFRPRRGPLGASGEGIVDDEQPRAVRLPAEIEEAARRDPIERLKRLLSREDTRLDEEAAAEVEAAVSWAEEQAPLAPDSIFDHAYSEPPARVAAQLAAFVR